MQSYKKLLFYVLSIAACVHAPMFAGGKTTVYLHTPDPARYKVWYRGASDVFGNRNSSDVQLSNPFTIDPSTRYSSNGERLMIYKDGRNIISHAPSYFKGKGRWDWTIDESGNETIKGS